MKLSHYKIVLFLSTLVCVCGFFFITCSRQDKLQARSDILYKKGDVINLNIENFLQPNTDKAILERAILYSSLLNSDLYQIDENCNVVTKGKEYLEPGEYEVTIFYKGQVLIIPFQVIE